jgi:hypothetical protein
MSAGPGVFADSQLVAALMAVGQLSRYLFFRVFPYYYPGKFARAAQNRRPFAVSPFRRFQGLWLRLRHAKYSVVPSALLRLITAIYPRDSQVIFANFSCLIL